MLDFVSRENARRERPPVDSLSLDGVQGRTSAGRNLGTMNTPNPVGVTTRALVALLVALALAGSVGTAGAAQPRRVLPDLVPQPPERLIGPTTGFSLGLGVDAPFLVDGCYPEERARKGAARCLRFDTIVGNPGAGAFELAYGADARETVAAIQRIYRSDGSYRDRFAVRSELHPTHAHFHVQDFYLSRLGRRDRTASAWAVPPSPAATRTVSALRTAGG